MERSRGVDDSGDDYTTMNGVKPIISTNTFAVNGTLYKTDFDEFLVEQGLRYGSRDKVLIASTAAILAFTQMVDERLNFNVDISPQKGKTFGVEVLRYMAPNGGSILIMEDRNISNYYNGEAYLLDMNELTRYTFSNNGISGELEIIADTKDPDDLGRVSTIIGDMGLTYGNELNHAKLTGISGGSYSSAKA
jgi:hypothetical protein